MMKMTKSTIVFLTISIIGFLSFRLTNNHTLMNPEGGNVKDRFNLPPGFKRVESPSGSFQNYLQCLPLKDIDEKVHTYNGCVKEPSDVYSSVVDMDIGKKDLQQCADAVMRLRAEHLYLNNKYSDIHFNFTNGFNAEYSKWKEGYRFSIKGNSVAWVKKAKEDSSYLSFRKYLDYVFMYAGTLSLSKELKSKEIKDLNIGDVFIQGGSPGHAVIVVDKAIHSLTAETIYLFGTELYAGSGHPNSSKSSI